MATLFIADIHLSPQEPAITAGFVHFLAGIARTAEALYILGDLFETWIGDDDPDPLHQQIATAIKALVDSGVACYFIHGNRDFLLGKRFARLSGMILLPEQQSITLYHHKIVILHGDTLCSDDVDYQAFRKKVRQPWLQGLFRVLPLSLRKKIAAKMRAGSQSANSNKASDIMDVNAQAVVNAFSHHQAQWMIHGHTHRPAIHPLSVNGKSVRRCVLGAWHSEGSMVKVTPENIELIRFAL